MSSSTSTKKSKPLQELSNNKFNTPNALMNIRHTAICLSLTADFISHDLEKLIESDNPEVIKHHIQTKLNYIHYCCSRYDDNIRRKIPPEGTNSAYFLNDIVKFKDPPDEYDTVVSPPVPYVEGSELELPTYDYTFSSTFLKAKETKKNVLDIEDEYEYEPELSAVENGPVDSSTTAKSKELPTCSSSSARANTMNNNNNTKAQEETTDATQDKTNDTATSEASNLLKHIKQMSHWELMEQYCRQVVEYKEKKSTISGTKFIKLLIDKKIINVKERCFKSALNRYQEWVNAGNKSEDWVWVEQRRGNNHFVPLEDVAKVLIPEGQDEAIGLKGMIEKLTNIKRKRAEEAGQCPELVSDVCKKTALGYITKAAGNKRSKIRKSVNKKSRLRYIGERSQLSTYSYAHTLAASHFVISDTEPAYAKDLPPVSSATDGAKKLYDYVKKCNPGKFVTPVHPMMIHSTDDSTVYALAGKENDKDGEWVLVGNETEDEKNSTYGSFTTDPDKEVNLKGRRVRVTTTISAGGTCAPLFITVYGMTERDLPRDKYPDGVHVEKLKGLCIGGSQDPFNEGYGYVCFCRKKNPKGDKVTPDHAAMGLLALF